VVGDVDEVTQERIARNEALFRDANERIEARALDLGADGLVPFICECADRSCTEIVRLPPAEYEEVRADSRQFLNALGHELPSLAVADVVAERSGYLVVRKRALAGEIAEHLDARRAEGGERHGKR
jgi:hypothetical protein